MPLKLHILPQIHLTLIDLFKMQHYYAQMKIRAIILVSTFISLIGCSHFETNTNHKIANAGDNSLPTTHNKIDSLNQNSSVEKPIIYMSDVHVDLIARIKSGFRLPELHSKDIKQYEKWSSKHPTYLSNLLNRAEPFLFYILDELEKRDMPTEIVLLPAIESAFKPNAISKSKAGGLWQFIPSTGKYYGLKQDWWYDGRRDVIASTTAALDYLTVLNKQFKGDWFLTLAAYNAGPGTLKKAIKSNQLRGLGTEYQQLKLRSETRRYVPKLIALKNIISNPEKFDVTLPNMPNTQYFRTVTLTKQIDLNEFASRLIINIDEFKHLNAGHLRSATSPDGPHRVLIPLDSTPDLAAFIENLNTGDLVTQAKQDNQLSHTVIAGDTLWSIARRYSVQITELLTWNNLTKHDVLDLNQILKVFPN